MKHFLAGRLCQKLLLQQRSSYALGTRHISKKSETEQKLQHERHCEEIEIPVPWGHIAGKWYGPRDIRPIVGLHGWQDNASTFDTLAPLLPAHIPFLSLDLPGHGRSSWLPPGFCYHHTDYVLLLRRIMESQQWSKISLVGHSLGGILSFVFNGVFPDKVDMLVSIDVLQPIWHSSERAIDHLVFCIDKFLEDEARFGYGDTEPPCYTWPELVERLCVGMNGSVDRNGCEILAKRNSKPSKREPGKFYFSRDNRLKSMIPAALSPEMSLALSRRMSCPHMYIKFLQAPYFGLKRDHTSTLAVLRQSANFELLKCNGTHHAHLNNPADIAPALSAFILKHRGQS